jgi:hypothetical protein
VSIKRGSAVVDLVPIHDAGGRLIYMTPSEALVMQLFRLGSWCRKHPAALAAVLSLGTLVLIGVIRAECEG